MCVTLLDALSRFIILVHTCSTVIPLPNNVRPKAISRTVFRTVLSTA